MIRHQAEISHFFSDLFHQLWPFPSQLFFFFSLGLPTVEPAFLAVILHAPEQRSQQESKKNPATEAAERCSRPLTNGTQGPKHQHPTATNTQKTTCGFSIRQQPVQTVSNKPTSEQKRSGFTYRCAQRCPSGMETPGLPAGILRSAGLHLLHIQSDSTDT